MIKITDFNTLVKWYKSYGWIQKNYFKDPIKIRREKQIEDFVYLNDFSKCHVVKENYILKGIKSYPLNESDLVIVTSQTFSRYPVQTILRKIKEYLYFCPKLYLCLNSFYVNIDNSYQDKTLSDNPNKAITQWLQKSLDAKVIDMSLDYKEDGRWFTWVIPDRHYFISK